MEDRRRSAEIRRMASQKVAVEFVKVFVGPDTELDAAKNLFSELTDWIDDDVVSAGDRAEAPRAATPSPTPQNGSEAGREADKPLTAEQQAKVVKLLEEVDPELLKLKFFEMELPQTTIPEAVAKMTKIQAASINAWRKLQKEKHGTQAG